MDSRASCNLMYESLTGVPPPSGEEEEDGLDWEPDSLASKVAFMLGTHRRLLGVTHGEVKSQRARSGRCKLTTSLSLAHRVKNGHQPTVVFVDEADVNLSSVSLGVSISRQTGCGLVLLSATLGTRFPWISPANSVPGEPLVQCRPRVFGPMDKCLGDVLLSLVVPNETIVLVLVSSIRDGSKVRKLIPEGVTVDFFDGLLTPTERREAVTPPSEGWKVVIATSSIARSDLKRVSVVLTETSYLEFGVDSFGRSFAVTFASSPARCSQLGGRAGRRGEPLALLEGSPVKLITFGPAMGRLPECDMESPIQVGAFFGLAGVEPDDLVHRWTASQCEMADLGYHFASLPGEGSYCLKALRAFSREREACGLDPLSPVQEMGTLVALYILLGGMFMLSEEGGNRVAPMLGTTLRQMMREYLRTGFVERLVMSIELAPDLFGRDGETLESDLEVLFPEEEGGASLLADSSEVDLEALAWCCPFLVGCCEGKELILPAGVIPAPPWCKQDGLFLVDWRRKSVIALPGSLLPEVRVERRFSQVWEGRIRFVGEGNRGTLIEELEATVTGHARRLDYLLNHTARQARDGEPLGVKTEGWSLADVLSVLLLTLTREAQGEFLGWILQSPPALALASRDAEEVDATRAHPFLRPLVGAVQASFRLVRFGMSATKTLFSLAYAREGREELSYGTSAVVTGGDDGGSIIMAQIPCPINFGGPGMINFLQELGFVSLSQGQLECKVVFHLKTRLWARAVKGLTPGVEMGGRHPIRILGELLGLDRRSPDFEHVGPTLQWLVKPVLSSLLSDEKVKVNLAPLFHGFGIPVPRGLRFMLDSRLNPGRATLKEAFARLGPSNNGTTESGMAPFLRALEEVSELLPASPRQYEEWIRWAEANGGLCFSLPQKEKVFYPAKSSWERILSGPQERPVTSRLVPAWFLLQNPELLGEAREDEGERWDAG